MRTCLSLILLLIYTAPLLAQPATDTLAARLDGTSGAARLAVLVELVEAKSYREPAVAIDYGRAAQALLADHPDARLAGRLYYKMGEAFFQLNAFDSVATFAGRVFALAETLDDGALHADASNMMGVSRQAQGYNAEALAYYREALDYHRAQQNTKRMAVLLYNVGMTYRRLGRLDASLAHLREAHALYKTQGHRRGLAAVHQSTAHIYNQRGEYEEARANQQEALSLYEAMEDRRGIARLRNDLGNTERKRGAFEAAMDQYQQALAIHTALNNLHGQSSVHINIGLLEAERGRYAEALTAYNEALTLIETRGNPRRLGSLFNNIGNVYTAQGDHEQALHVYQQALGELEALAGDPSLYVTMDNIGKVLFQLGQLDQAQAILDQALAGHEAAGDRNSYSRTLITLGQVYRTRGESGRAEAAFREALTIKKEIGSPLGVAAALRGIGLFYQGQGRLVEAEAAIEEALALCRAAGAMPRVAENWKVLAEILTAQQRHAEALDAFKQYTATTDTLRTADGQSLLAMMQARFAAREQEQQIALLTQQRRLQAAIRNGLLLVILLITLVATLLYSRYRIKNEAHRELAAAHDDLQRTQAQLIQTEKMASLGQLTAGIAHEIKNPLNFINNFATLNVELADELIEELDAHRTATVGTLRDELADLFIDLRDNAGRIAEHGRRADRIVKNMMQHAQGERGSRKQVNLNHLVSEHLDLAYHGMRARHSSFDVELDQRLSGQPIILDVLPQEIGRVMLNIIDNAFYAMHLQAQAHPGSYRPVLEVSTTIADGMAEVRVRDNGPGIPEEDQRRIFEPFFTTKPAGAGTGLGLSLSYDVVVQGHGGRLAVHSDPGAGATFVVSLPLAVAVPDRRTAISEAA